MQPGSALRAAVLVERKLISVSVWLQFHRFRVHPSSHERLQRWALSQQFHRFFVAYARLCCDSCL